MNLCDVTVTQVECIFNVSSEKGRRLNMNNRRYYGLSFCKSGKIEYVKDGVKTISDTSCAVIIPKGASYTLFGSETGEFPLVNFDTDIQLTSDFLRIPIRNPESYMRDFERMREFWQNPYGKAKAMSIFYGILDRLCHEEASATPILASVIKYLSESFTDPTISNESLAARANISEVYMRRLFFKEMGTTPKQYVLELRLRLAKQLLLERSLSVTDIAEKCGFSSVYHFCRVFKLATGQTPTEFASSYAVF